MSLLPSPLKSPVPAARDDGPGSGGALPGLPAAMILRPFISQMPTWPLVFWRRTSLLPSPLKSLVGGEIESVLVAVAEVATPSLAAQEIVRVRSAPPLVGSPLGGLKL